MSQLLLAMKEMRWDSGAKFYADNNQFRSHQMQNLLAAGLLFIKLEVLVRYLEHSSKWQI